MYLSRGGRLSGAKAMLGTALGLKPLLKGDPNGRIVLCGKARGRAQAIGKLADQYNALVRYPGDQTVCIAHGNAPQEAEALAKATEAVEKKEAEIMRHILEDGTYIRPWVDAKLKEIGCEILE